MSGGTMCKISVGRSSGASSNALYVTRENAVKDKEQGVLMRHMEKGIEGQNFAELRTNVSSYFWAREEVEIKTAPKNLSGKKKLDLRAGEMVSDDVVKERKIRTNYRAILSFEREVETDKAKAMVNEWLSLTPFKNAPAIAALHRDTAHPHAHVLIDARRVDGKKVDLSPRQYRTLDEVWNKIYSREFGIDEQEYLTKKSETRAYKRAVVEAKQKGEPLPERPTRAPFPMREVFDKRDERASQSIAQDDLLNATQRFDRSIKKVGSRIKKQFNLQSALERQTNVLAELESRIETLRQMEETIRQKERNLHYANEGRTIIRESDSQRRSRVSDERNSDCARSERSETSATRTEGSAAHRSVSREETSSGGGRALTTGSEIAAAARSLEAALTTQEQYVLKKFDEVVQIVNDTYKNRDSNSELRPEIKLAIAEQASESSLRPVVDSQIAAINYVASAESIEPPVFENRVEASVWLVKQSKKWREQWANTMIAAARSRVEFKQEQTRHDRNIIGESIATKYELIHAQHQLESANSQEHIRRYKVETPDGTRRLSVNDVRQQARASADRVASKKLDAAIAEEQKRPQGERRSATELRLDLHTKAIAEELAKHADLLAAIREKHAQAVTTYERGLDTAKSAEAIAKLNAATVAASYKGNGKKAPALFIAPERLNKLQDEAIARREPATILVLDDIRHTQAPNSADYSPIRSNEAAARLKTQTRLAELNHLVVEQRGRDFEATAHLRRFHVEGHDRNEYSKSDAPDQARHPNYEWSLKDVATAVREAKKNEKYYERSAQHYETHANFSNLVKNLANGHLNPLTHLQSATRIITNPTAAINSHFNPLKLIQHDPLVQIGRFVYEAVGARKKAAELRELAKAEAEKAARLETAVRPEVIKQTDVARAELRTEITESRELTRGLNSTIEKEVTARAATNTRMPKAFFREEEIREVGARAMELSDGTVLKQYEKLAQAGQANGLLQEESLAARAGARQTVAAARVINAQARLDELTKPIGTEEMRVRDVTPVKVEIEGEVRVMTLRDAINEPEAIKNIVERELATTEENLRIKIAKSREFYDTAHAIATEYKTDLAARAGVESVKPPLPQFSAEEYIEIENFAASIKDAGLHKRFTEISESAIKDNRVIGSEKAVDAALDPVLKL